VVRLLFVVSLLLPGPQFVVYLGLWLLMPVEPRLGAGGEPARLPPS
jgi:phage shock protein PspC (stress-responsive transcriptional regulator)